MNKFDGLDKLQLQDALRKLEMIPKEFSAGDLQEIHMRLDRIREDEQKAEIARDERKHGEAIAAARRSRIASVLSVLAAIVSAAAAAVSAYYAYADHSPRAARPIAQPNTATPTPEISTPAPSASTTTTPSATPFHLSDGNAQQKYERATNLPPNWATQECVDIIVRYPNSPEATLAADMLIEKWDHILHRDFLTLTGQRLPVDYDPPQADVVAMLKAAFARRGVHPTR